MKQWLLAGLCTGMVGAWVAHAETGAPAAAPVLSSEDQERVTKAQAAVEAIQEHIGKLETEMDKARGSKDIVKLNYLSDKLKAIKGLMKVCTQSVNNLQDALVRHDVSAANREEEKIGIATAKADTLFEQTQSAVGQSTVFSGSTQVEVTVNEAVAGLATAVNPAQAMLTAPPSAVVVTIRPPAASPYQ